MTRKILILGATSGMGRALALRYAAEPDTRVMATGRRAERLAELEETGKGQILTLAFDLTAPDRMEKLAQSVEKLGGCDMAVISAGWGKINPALEWGPTEQTLMLDVVAFTAVADWLYLYFAKQGFGHLVEIASVAGLRGLDNCSGYSAAKAYNICYMEGLKRKSVKEKANVTLTTLLPGFVDTDLIENKNYIWMMNVDDAVKSMMRAIRRRKTVAYITPRWRIVGWLMKFTPSFLFNRW